MFKGCFYFFFTAGSALGTDMCALSQCVQDRSIIFLFSDHRFSLLLKHISPPSSPPSSPPPLFFLFVQDELKTVKHLLSQITMSQVQEKPKIKIHTVPLSLSASCHI